MSILVSKKEAVNSKGIRETIEKYMEPTTGITFVMVKRNTDDINGKKSMFDSIFAEFGTLDLIREKFPYASCIMEKPQGM